MRYVNIEENLKYNQSFSSEFPIFMGISNQLRGGSSTCRRRSSLSNIFDTFSENLIKLENISVRRGVHAGSARLDPPLGISSQLLMNWFRLA